MRGVLAVVCVLASSGVAVAKSGGCVIEGKSVDAFPVTVTSKGGPPLHVRVREVPATARVGETGPAAVEVRGALAFSGTTPVEKLPLKPKARLDASNGMLRLGAGAGHVIGQAKGKWIEGDATIDGIRFRGVRFPCDGLTLDAVDGGTAQTDDDEEGWTPAARTLTLRFGANSGPSMTIELADNADLELHQLDRAGAWMRVTRRFRDGSYLNGWAQASALKKQAPRRAELSDLPITSSCAHPPEARPGTQIVSAPVAAGTEVFFDRLFAWAKVTSATPLTVRYTPGERWVELVGVPGFATADECESNTVLDEAWVPRTAVTLPDDGAKK